MFLSRVIPTLTLVTDGCDGVVKLFSVRDGGRGLMWGWFLAVGRKRLVGSEGRANQG